MSATGHSYRTFSFRGSWPRYQCVYCGCVSTSDKAKQRCEEAPQATRTTSEGREDV